jgi:hypothetical protein
MRLFMLFTVALVSLASCASAQTIGDKAERMSKVAQELIYLYDEYSSYLTSHSAKPFQPANPLVRVIDSRVVVDAVASGEVNVLKADLVSLGMQRAVAFGRIVSGELPISAIPAMAALPSLNFARAASGLRQGGGDFFPQGCLDDRCLFQRRESKDETMACCCGSSPYFG